MSYVFYVVKHSRASRTDVFWSEVSQSDETIDIFPPLFLSACLQRATNRRLVVWRSLSDRRQLLERILLLFRRFKVSDLWLVVRGRRTPLSMPTEQLVEVRRPLRRIQVEICLCESSLDLLTRHRATQDPQIFIKRQFPAVKVGSLIECFANGWLHRFGVLVAQNVCQPRAFISTLED